MHDPLCIYCGARLIQHIKQLAIRTDWKAERCRAVLADWMAAGHAEKTIRALANEKALVHEPPQPKQKKRGSK